MIRIGNTRSAYLCFISIILIFLYTYDIIIVSDPNVYYSEEIKVGLSVFIAFVLLIFIWSMAIYFKYITEVNQYSILMFKLIAFSSSIFLIYFGFVTLRVDEIINKTPGFERHSSYEYLTTKDKNDLASILSILLGIFSSIMILLF
jgi:hypothetical protein